MRREGWGDESVPKSMAWHLEKGGVEGGREGGREGKHSCGATNDKY